MTGALVAAANAGAETILPVRDRLAVAARAIEPILNRVVLAGPPVVELLMNDQVVRAPALTFAADATLQLLTTSMVDRIGGDLQKLGLLRTGRSATADRWRVSDEVTLDLVQVRTDDADPDQVWLEYATLLTLPFTVDDRITVRIAGAPAVIALECAAYLRSGEDAFDSERIERIVLLIAGRMEIEKECAAAPPELRAIIASTLAPVVRGGSIQLLIQRALPDAALVPALARRIQERILRIAS